MRSKGSRGSEVRLFIYFDTASAFGAFREEEGGRDFDASSELIRASLFLHHSAALTL